MKETDKSSGKPIVTDPHAALVELAVKWLRNGARIPVVYKPFERRVKCSVVFAEMVTSAQETPDAIGFFNSGDRSVLVECKVSRSDFRAGLKKMFRKFPDWGMGDYRYYLTPPNLLTVDDLPTGWGLLETASRGLKMIQIAERQEKKISAEVNILWSAVRRLQTKSETYMKPIRCR